MHSCLLKGCTSGEALRKRRTVLNVALVDDLDRIPLRRNANADSDGIHFGDRFPYTDKHTAVPLSALDVVTAIDILCAEKDHAHRDTVKTLVASPLCHGFP